MCRLLAYRGKPIFLSELICIPPHSLVRQSVSAERGETGTNGDGFGLSWYGERIEPGLFREARPAWSDENLQALCHQVRSRLFFAHVRSSTGTPTNRANCHPFSHGKWLFMHNGQIGGYAQIRRNIEAMIPDDLYGFRMGSSDSEAIFLAALANGLDKDPVRAMIRTLRAIHGTMIDAGIAEPFRFTATLTDGQTVFGFRWASDTRPPTLYYRRTSADVVVASEPVDGCKEGWHEIRPNCSFKILPDGRLSFDLLNDLVVKLAA